jgi:hypothetical protein
VNNKVGEEEDGEKLFQRAWHQQTINNGTTEAPITVTWEGFSRNFVSSTCNIIISLFIIK